MDCILPNHDLVFVSSIYQIIRLEGQCGFPLRNGYVDMRVWICGYADVMKSPSIIKHKLKFLRLLSFCKNQDREMIYLFRGAASLTYCFDQLQNSFLNKTGVEIHVWWFNHPYLLS